MTTYTEAVRLAIEGEEAGFNTLYESTYQSKYYLALKYMQNEEAAKDVLQDSYIKAFSSLDTLDEPEKFPSWLGIIVANTAKNALKKKNPILFADIATDPEEEYEYQIEDENIQNQPEIAYSQKEVQELVQEMIDSLSEEQRMCILMFHIEEQSIREIADALGCSENTVKSRLNYGRKNIKQKAEELQKKGYRFYTIAFLVLLLHSEEKALAAQKQFHKAGTAMKEHIMKSLPRTEMPQPGAAGAEGQQAASQMLKQGFLHTAAGKMTAAGIGICIVVAGIVYGVLLGKSNPSDPSTSTTANVQTAEPAASVPTGTPEHTEGAVPTGTPEPTEEALQAGRTTEESDPALALFKKLPKQFSFSSGAGGWGTTLNLKEDGSFSGKYSDSDLGDTGKKYPNGTVYICKFKGKFSSPKKINKYTYSTRLESLEQEGKPDTVYYKKGKRYIVGGPYGLEGADKFRIYLPNAPISKLPQEFLSWAFWQEPESKKLGLYGIYNVAQGQGFTGYKK